MHTRACVGQAEERGRQKWKARNNASEREKQKQIEEETFQLEINILLLTSEFVIIYDTLTYI